jgi:23S rRNA U2552 (ribose-2'-O)-methylase RlmE/FtsJ
MNDLKYYFAHNNKNYIHKFDHYLDIYDRYFKKYRDKEVFILEIGVFQGGSLQMWKDYFGAKAKIYGLDINPHCKKLEEDQIEIIIGDQSNDETLKSLLDIVPRIDILIDDGGHVMDQQIKTFETLYPHVHDDGLYICEDLHTSYWRSYGGGYRKEGTFIEYSKTLIDYINAWHSRDKKKLNVSDFTKSTYALHYYDSMIVIEKKQIAKPFTIETGKSVIPNYEPILKKKRLFARLWKMIRNRALSLFRYNY